MILFPRKTKHVKYHKGKKSLNLIEHKYNIPLFGLFGLKVKKNIRLKTNQIEAARKTIRKKIKKRARNILNITIFTDKIATKKASGIRMGKGKGNTDYWYTRLKKGRIFFELKKKIGKPVALKALIAGSKKIPAKCKFISKV